MNNSKHREPFVIIEVLGGVVSNIINPYRVPVRVVNWDNLEGIQCPECGSTMIATAATARENRFICGNEHEFIVDESGARLAS